MNNPGGAVIARLLKRAWRPDQPPADFPVDDLAQVEAQLMASGSAGLAWWRIRADETLRESAVGSRLHDAFRMHTLHAGLNEEHIERVLNALASEGIQALLFKGWDAARMYPEPGLRPYGDIDLLVRPQDMEHAREVCSRLPEGSRADLVHDVETFGSTLDALFAASGVARLASGYEVRVPSKEDRLRLLGLHTLKHGAWRPLWLCDVGIAVETRGDDFDWHRCLTQSPVVQDWVTTIVALSGALLGADISPTPAAGRVLPRWLVRAVLSRWGVPFPERYGTVLEPLAMLRDPVDVARGLRKRWADPISATVAMKAQFNSVPRAPIQVAYALRRTAGFVARRGAHKT